MIIVNGFQPLTIITKRSTLDVVAVLDSPLSHLSHTYHTYHLHIVHLIHIYHIWLHSYYIVIPPYCFSAPICNPCPG